MVNSFFPTLPSSKRPTGHFDVMQDTLPLKEKLSQARRIVITTHHKPDADALGSSLAMANYLGKKGHQARVITPSEYPAFLNWMKGNDEVLVYSDQTKFDCEKLINEAEVIFALDFSALGRINDLGEMVRDASGFKVNVDHHLDPEDFADFQYWSTNAAATCELCYELILALGDASYVDADIADCLYAGIMTDTGGFRHPNTTKNVHEIVAQLIEKGANNAQVSKNIYDKNSHERLKFIGYALSERLMVFPELKVAYFAISAADQKKFNTRTGDSEGLVNYALSIEGITLAAFFKEAEGGVKLSLRSIGDFPANELAAEYFNGGGHKNAAGGKVEMSLEATVKLFLEAIKSYKKLLEEECKKV